jgi:outer membrane protein OmpA-like peptidoglycan-associated protein
MSEQARALTDEAQAGVAAFRDNMEALQRNFLLRGFFEKRGYNDAAELTQHAISRLPARARTKDFEYDTNEIFDKPDGAKLKYMKRLDEAGKYLEENTFSLAVVASSESKGDTDKARVLTEARAKVVRDYLAQNFKLEDKRLKTIGLGKTKDAGDSSKLVILIYPAETTAHPDQHPSRSSP